MANDLVLIRIEPEASRFAEGSGQWHREREALRSELHRELGAGAMREGAPESGDKGLPLVPIIVALGGAQAFHALARCFDSWLRHRPGERSLTVTGTVNGQDVSLSVSGQGLAIDALDPLIRGLGKTPDEE
jgi:hypothetical protein